MTSRRLVQPDFAPAHLARVYRGRAAGSDQFSLPPSWRRAMSGFYSLPVSFGFLRSCSANPRARKPRHVSAITFSCSFLQKQEGSRQFSYKSRVCLLKDLSQCQCVCLAQCDCARFSYCSALASSQPVDQRESVFPGWPVLCTLGLLFIVIFAVFAVVAGTRLQGRGGQAKEQGRRVGNHAEC